MFGVSFHTLLVHFPITLAMIAFGYDAWGVYTGQTRLHRVGSGLVKLGALAAILAAGTGLDLAGMSGLGSQSSVTGHAAVALAAATLMSVVAVVRYSAEMRGATGREACPAYLIAVEGLAAVLIAVAAVMGHRI